MSQLNIHLNPEFAAALARFMQLRGIRTKSDAVRIAVREGLDRSLSRARTPDFATWIGLGKGRPENPRPRFAADADLWS